MRLYDKLPWTHPKEECFMEFIAIVNKQAIVKWTHTHTKRVNKTICFDVSANSTLLFAHYVLLYEMAKNDKQREQGERKREREWERRR